MPRNPNIPYTRKELMAAGPQRTFTGRQLTEIAFPIGGIGTGTISLGGRGNLRDFEIFGRPAKGNTIPFTFFALWAKAEGEKPVAKILEGKVPPPYRSGFGEPQNQLQGVARFETASFKGEYPVATVELSDPAVPVTARLTAWNPFIPLNVKDSALPVGIYEWTFTNPSDKPVEISLAASMQNPATEFDENKNSVSAGVINEYQAVGKLKGIRFSHPDADPANPLTGTLALTTTWSDLDVQTRWYRGGWWDKCHIFWDDFSSDGRLKPVIDTEPAPGGPDIASIAMRATIPAGGCITIPVFITWHFPKMANPWPPAGVTDPKPLDTYVSHFENAWDVAAYVTKNLDRLRLETDRWRDAIFSNTLPAYVLEAITSQASVVRSPTCFLLADGNFFGWEGCHDNGGCCHGSCTHVWNYEQALAFLFPELERTMRRTEFLHNTRETGNMAFRSQLPPGSGIWAMKPCADGQMGTIIQVYRDWRLSGDDAFLREIWPKVKLALEYAWTMTPGKMAPPSDESRGRSIDSPWDPDKDGVMEGEQHNTYDIEFYGPNTMCTAMYLGALKACEEIARHLGETEKADEYLSIYESGRSKVEANLWNGEYYVQKVEVIDGVEVPDFLKSPADETCGPECPCKQSPGGKAPALGNGDVMPKYQYGEGCLSDQLLGQWASHVAGIGYILDPERVRTAVGSIFSYNFLPKIGDFSNVQRVYALNDEPGLLLCSWPHGNRPTLPFVYSDEVWTGIEYHVAAHLIYEGLIEEGLAIVRGVADRYSGDNRNPWNQVECGHHYARAMASWSVKLALDGFSFDLTAGRLGFSPKLSPERYSTFWSTGTGWGIYSQDIAEGVFRFDVLYGRQTVKELALSDLPDGKVAVSAPTGASAAQVEGRSVVFDQPVTIEVGQAVEIRAE